MSKTTANAQPTTRLPESRPECAKMELSPDVSEEKNLPFSKEKPMSRRAMKRV
jgi:hypothetical protein